MTPTRPTFTATARITLRGETHVRTATMQYDGLPKSGWTRTNSLASLGGEAVLAACKDLADQLDEVQSVDVFVEETVQPSFYCVDYGDQS
jgi:hypothetical protein